ncbi:MAG TPA: protein kinase [Polyangiaceae bacterium]|jgi:serine/threonine-protein kinase
MELLERYRPLYVIGRGGMGTIELAVERAAGPPRVVAIKRLLPAVRDREHESMFLREARLATLLNHPNVVHAIAFGEDDDELLIVMEYVEGETLARVAAERKLPLDVLALVLAEVCDGLDAAHELRDVGGAPLGLVHRDVSPQNVMLSYAGEVKLLDFGVAKLDSAHLTKTGDVKGKFAYMSPEQAMSEKLDRRSDLYGVGALLFELACGRRMWSGETDVELIRQLALGAPPSLADTLPDAPRALVDLHARLVSKKPGDRPARASEVASALRELVPDAERARASLVALITETFGAAARAKREKLEAALLLGDEGMAVTATEARPSRVAPWMYAILGAAVASVAVFAVARNRPQSVQAAPATSIAPSSSTAPAVTNFEIIEPAPLPTSTSTVSPRVRVRVRTQPAHVAPPAASSVAPPPIDVDTHPI